MIGGRTYIVSSNHKFNGNECPYMLQGEDCKKVIIGDNVWIGANCIILPGVSIGENCVIGAGSVVSKSFDRNQLIMGNPAKAIKQI